MYELIQLSEHDYYIDCPAKIGLIKASDNEVVLIDSGNDKDAGKKVCRILESKGWNLKAIFNTHSHADHIAEITFYRRKPGVRFTQKTWNIFIPICLYWNRSAFMAAVLSKN